MAAPNQRMKIETEYGEKMETLLPRMANELGSLTAVARAWNLSLTAIYKWSVAIGMARVCVYAVPGQVVRVNDHEQAAVK